jgi:EAL domain-containing protein (putative c-di-GMP-specific phosphodiesterase class I)
MYEAKKGGKNRYSVYDKMNDGNTVKRLDIENKMRQAIATEIQEFVVFYQPVVDVATKKCTSCEALVRWNSKALGFLGPGEFIPLAEYLGLITSIGDYVLEEACVQCREWNKINPDFHINVNLSVVQLLQKDAVKNVESILEKTGVNPKNIVLEITESFAINDMKRVMEIVEGLKKLGPRIALDDFGTGYSSLNYIKQLPLDLIKVDKTFIDDIVEDNYAQAFVKLIVDLSNTIDTGIVVEGVESEEQFTLLKDLGVNYIQGFLFGRPVPPDEFEKQHLRGKIGGVL